MNNFDFKKFFDDKNIKYKTSGKNIGGKGWTGIEICPKCGADNYHAAVNTRTGAISCWHCGGMSLKEFLKEMNEGSWAKVYKALEDYKLDAGEILKNIQESETEQVRNTSYKLPDDFSEKLPDAAKYYLRDRGFDYLQLKKDYGILYSGDWGKYKYRIIFPIREEKNGAIVSFVGKDITGLQEIPYLYCDDKEAVVPRRELLFNLDHCQSESVILTEGVFDAIRVGGIALLSVQFSPAQLLKLRRYKKFFIMFDNDSAGERMARKLEGYLTWAESINYVEYSTKDPGELDIESVRELRRLIL